MTAVENPALFAWVVEEKFLVISKLHWFEWKERHFLLTNWLSNCSVGLEGVDLGSVPGCLIGSEVRELHKYRMLFILEPEIPRGTNKSI